MCQHIMRSIKSQKFRFYSIYINIDGRLVKLFD